MALSNTAVPKYYGMFRDAVIRGEIPVCKEISMEMNRIDDLIANPGVYYDDQAVEGWIAYCESELTLTDGSDLSLLDSFKLWGEQIFGWYYFVERSVYQPNPDGHGGHYVRKNVKKRLINKQYLIVARGAAKSMYGSTLQGYFLNVDTSTTHQITTAPTMKQAEEVMSPLRTAITRSRGPLFQFLTEGSLQNTTGSKANRTKLASTKKGVENFLTGSLLEVRPMSINKLQGLQIKVATVDEWLSGDIREDVIGAIEQGASKVNDYIIVAISSEGTVRNGSGDTMVIFGSNKRVLHHMRQAISDYLEMELGLELKANWQVFRFSYGNNQGRDLDFMGFRFYRNRTILRKSIMYKATRKARKISKKEKATILDARQMLSYLGWIDCTDTYLMYRKWIKPCVSFQQLKRKVSRYDKYDEKRVYQKLVSLYTAKGGKSHGVKLQICREHSPTDCT